MKLSGFNQIHSMFTIKWKKKNTFLFKLKTDEYFSKSAVCNSFLNGLPEILDSNLAVANQVKILTKRSKIFNKISFLVLIWSVFVLAKAKWYLKRKCIDSISISFFR